MLYRAVLLILHRMHYQFYKLNLILLSRNSEHKGKYFNNLCHLFVKYQADTIWQYLLMDRLAQGRLTLCSEVIGKRQYPKIYNLKGRIPSFRICLQIKTLQDLFLGPFINSLIKLKFTKKLSQNLEYIAHSYKFTMKKYMISFKTSQSQKLWIFMNRNWMGFL